MLAVGSLHTKIITTDDRLNVLTIPHRIYSATILRKYGKIKIGINQANRETLQEKQPIFSGKLKKGKSPLTVQYFYPWPDKFSVLDQMV